MNKELINFITKYLKSHSHGRIKRNPCRWLMSHWISRSIASSRRTSSWKDLNQLWRNVQKPQTRNRQLRIGQDQLQNSRWKLERTTSQHSFGFSLEKSWWVVCFDSEGLLLVFARNSGVNNVRQARNQRRGIRISRSKEHEELLIEHKGANLLPNEHERHIRLTGQQHKPLLSVRKDAPPKNRLHMGPEHPKALKQRPQGPNVPLQLHNKREKELQSHPRRWILPEPFGRLLLCWDEVLRRTGRGVWSCHFFVEG